MATAAIMVLVFGLVVVVAALLLGGGWVLRRMLPTSHVLQARLKSSHLRGTALWIIERTELWTLVLIVAFVMVVTLVYS